MAVRLGHWKRGKMAIMASYVDAAGSPSELAVASTAMISTPEKWLEFEREWNACLDSYKVNELHMKHFAHSRGEYKGWERDQPKRKRFLNNLMWIIETYIEYTATDAVYMKAYNAHDARFQLSEHVRPYTMGCFSVAGRVFKWGESRGVSRDDFVWLFERGDTDQSDLRKHWEKEYPDMMVDPIFLRKKDKYPDPKVCKRQRPFEAADFVAYENLKVHKLLDERGDEPVYDDELRKPIQRMQKWPGASDWGYFGDENIARVCQNYSVPPRIAAV
jgi:murein L,D-transpeptidase YcbB/YkuD